MANNIQKYRKQCGYSQDELAGKLLVSRQTVSQWETGQTMPTTDNLLRLKDIFGVSVDALLGLEDEKEESAVPTPLEKYLFEYNADEIKTLVRQIKKDHLLPSAFFFILFLILFIMSSVFNETVWVSTTGVILLACLFVFLLTFKRITNANKDTLKRMLSARYEYLVFADYFVINIYHASEKTSSFRLKFSEIQNMRTTGKLLLLNTSSGLFVLRKEELMPASAFSKVYSENYSGWRHSPFIALLSKVLVALSATSLVFSFFAMDTAEKGFSNAWIFFVFALLPIASIVFGIIGGKKGFAKNKKNIVVGIIFTVLLCVFGALGLIHAHVFSQNDTTALVRLEQYTQTDFPETQHAVNMTYDKDNTTVAGLDTDTMEPVTMSYFQFEESPKEIENILKINSHWHHPPDKEILDILMPLQYSKDLYVCLYNETDNSFNTLPSKSGKYLMYEAVFDAKTGRLEINEYYLKVE